MERVLNVHLIKVSTMVEGSFIRYGDSPLFPTLTAATASKLVIVARSGWWKVTPRTIKKYASTS